MGRIRRLLVVLGCVAGGHAIAGRTPPAVAQPASRPGAVRSPLPPALVTQLDQIEDFAPRFDEPGYYALLAYVKNTPPPPAAEGLEIEDWGRLLEHPRDLRGAWVTITGTIGRNKAPYVHTRHRQLGRVWQVELYRRDAPLACTVVFTEDVGDLPLGAEIRLSGYFLKIRSFKTLKGQERLSAVLIAAGPSEVVRTVRRVEEEATWRWLFIAGMLGLVFAWFLLRRATRAPQRPTHELHANRPAPMNLSDDLAAWAAEEHTESRGDAEPEEGVERAE